MIPVRDATKLGRLRELASSRQLDALILQLPENVVYVTDYWPLLGMTFVVFPVDGEPALVHSNFETEAKTWIKDVRIAVSESVTEVADAFANGLEVVRQVLEDRGLARAKVGYEGSFSSVGTGFLKYRTNSVTPGSLETMKRKLPGVSWEDATDLLYEARSIKTELELEKLRVANEVSGFGLEAMYLGLTEGVREVDLATKIENASVTRGVGYRGAEHVIACAFVSSGEFTAETYGVCFGNSPKKLRKGDFVMLEYDVVVDGYSSDMSRTYVVGQPDLKQRHLLETVYEAQVEGVRMEKDGLPAKEVCKKAEDIIRKGGYGEHLKHYFGHGVGVTIWEPHPYIHSKSSDLLKAGMVHSAEPGAYVHGYGGVRIEDNVFLSRSGPVYLSTYRPIQE